MAMNFDDLDDDDRDGFDFKSILDMRVAERTRELLEDFDVVGTRQQLALLPRGRYDESLPRNIRAAMLASSLGLKSIDGVKRRYCPPEEEEGDGVDPYQAAYAEAYKTSKSYVSSSIRKLRTKGRPQPTFGVFGAAAALERLPSSFFCAHFLFNMGHSFEGYAISRVVLEQIAWSCAAFKSGDDLDAISRIKTTKSINDLKCLDPDIGQMYGFLSDKTHIDFHNRREYLKVVDGRNTILHTQSHYDDYGATILILADLFVLAWELSQFDYINNPEAIVVEANKRIPNPERPFVGIMHERMEVLKATKPVTDTKK